MFTNVKQYIFVVSNSTIYLLLNAGLSTYIHNFIETKVLLLHITIPVNTKIALKQYLFSIMISKDLFLLKNWRLKNIIVYAGKRASRFLKKAD